MIYQDFYSSPLGEMRLLSDDNGLCGVYFVGQKYDLYGFEKEEIIPQMTSFLKAGKNWLDAYFSSQDLPDVPLSMYGTDFQKKVWEMLQVIPVGECLSYGQLAQKLSCKSSQAIGGAVGKNPLSIIVPCHRIIGSDGSLVGYAGGLKRKAWLLEHERGS